MLKTIKSIEELEEKKRTFAIKYKDNLETDTIKIIKELIALKLASLNQNNKDESKSGETK